MRSSRSPSLCRALGTLATRRPPMPACAQLGLFPSVLSPTSRGGRPAAGTAPGLWGNGRRLKAPEWFDERQVEALVGSVGNGLEM